MTLAGTRPILQDELRQYELHHRARIAIKPGITGMWQVSGRSDITDLEDNFVIGNVGRLHFQKNQDFMIEIFRELIKKIPKIDNR